MQPFLNNFPYYLFVKKQLPLTWVPPLVLSHCYCVLWVAGQQRMAHTGNFRLRGEELCHLEAAAHVLLHPVVQIPGSYHSDILIYYLNSNVAKDLRTRKQSKADGVAPLYFCILKSFSFRSISLIIRAPMITSECPLRYLVTECITMSTPSSSGLITHGVKNVLSITILASSFTFLTLIMKRNKK